METQYLKEAMVLMETLSFSEAANRLFISQSSLSKHIRVLEEELGVSLFYRDRRHVEPTKYGVAILPAAHTIAQAEQSIARTIKSISDNNLITVGVSPSMSNDPFYQALISTGFQLANGRVQLRVMVEDTESLLNLLRAGTCDYAFLRSVEGERRFSGEFQTIPYKMESLKVVLPTGHPLAKKDALTFSELRHENFLLLQISSFSTKLCESECSKAGFLPNAVFYSHSGSFIRSLVAQGRGIFFISSDTLEQEDARLTCRPIAPPVPIYVTLCYGKERVLVEKDRLFLEFYRNYK